MTGTAWTVSAFVTLLAAIVSAAQTPQERCDQARATAWATYASCVGKLIGKDAACAPTASCGSTFNQLAAFGKCQVKYTGRWQLLQASGSLAGSTCRPGNGARFVDNLDGTVTDLLSTLQWEKKTGTVGGSGSGTDHDDVNNIYTWTASGVAADGAAFTTFLRYLSGGEPSSANGCLGGDCDWRLPTLAELQSLLNLTCTPGSGCSCATNPCIDPSFPGPTQNALAANGYWCGATPVTNPTSAWNVPFDNGQYYQPAKTAASYVRAVRGGF